MEIEVVLIKMPTEKVAVVAVAVAAAAAVETLY